MAASVLVEAGLLYEALCLTVTAVILGAWRQATQIAETPLNKGMDWEGPKYLLISQAVARLSLALGPELGAGLGRIWPAAWGEAAWTSQAGRGLALALIAASAIWCASILEHAVPRAVTHKAIRKIFALAGGACAPIQAFCLGSDAAGVANLAAGFCFCVYGCALLCLARKYRQGKVLALSAILIGVGGSSWLGGLMGWPSLAMVSMAAGSLASQGMVHARVIEVSGNRAKGAAPWIGAGNWVISSGCYWGFAWMGYGLPRGPSLVLALGGLLLAATIALHHFGVFQLAIAHYIEKFGDDKRQWLLNGVAAAAFLTDADGRVEAHSASARNLTGAGQSEIAGTELRHLFSINGAWPKGPWDRFESWEAAENGERLLLFEQKPLPAEAYAGSVVTVTDVTTEREAVAALERLSRTDALTELPNRREALSRLTGYVGLETNCFAVAFADLDHFKNANDIEGHGFGDALLQELSRKFEQVCVDMGGWVARFGGDEFLFCLPAGSGEEDVKTLWARLIGDIENSEANRRYSVGISLGAALFPRDGHTPEALIKHADAAMFKAKAFGRGRLEFFGHDLEREIVARVAIEASLRRCLSDNAGFHLYVQPVVHVLDATLAGGECLLRFLDPQLCELNIHDILAAAESSGQIIPLGYEVLEQSLRIAERLDAFSTDIHIAVNLSASQFNDPCVWKTLADWARQRGGARGKVKLEVTEMAVAKDAEKAKRLLEDARQQGYRISLDDFGTGYSSLSTLRRLPFTEMKMDKTLLDDVMQNEQARRVAEATMTFAEALGVEVVAEGVEHAEQARWLREGKRCRYGQGFYWARPMPWEDFLALARSGKSLEARVACVPFQAS
jgi:diguanylate cyclase (GGDEF)-like protein